MKKLLCMLLALLLMGSLMACGDKTPDDPVDPDPNPGQATTDPTPGNKDISVKDLMSYPESPESDFECFDYGNGEVELVGYHGTNEIVVIPDTWNGKKITTIAKFVFANNSPVKAIRLSDSITKIDGSAFAMNKSLEVAVCGKGLTEIGDGAFQSCSNLKELVLNDGLVKLGHGSIGDCDALKKLEVPASATDISHMAFYSCPDDFVIIGKAGSAAEAAATAKNITFQAN